MKRSAIIILALAALAAPAASSVAQAQQPSSTPILPGYWEYTTRVLGFGPAKKKCLKADEVEDFLSKPCNRHYTCVYPTKQVGGGKLVLDGYWQNKEGQRAKVKATGTYQAKAFSIKANGSAIGGIPFVASMEAKWLSAECPAGS
jgi:hypothetical protein